MPVFETFTKRQKTRERQGQPDVYQYKSLPEPFQVQVIHIWRSAIGPYFTEDPYGFRSTPISNNLWHNIHDALARELGVFKLADGKMNPFAQCQQFLLKSDTSGALDIIELSFRLIDREVRSLNEYQRGETGITQDPDDAIEELNHRFREHTIGYQYVEGELIRTDSQYIHTEIVLPAVTLLSHEGFRGASDEFLRAHDHYRKERYKEAVTDALKAFESTMKTICEARKWSYPPNATAKPLIDILLQNDLIPSELAGHFGSLRAAMESGLPTLSNRLSRHGQGREPRRIPGHIAAYALHLAASNMVFLVEAHRALK